MINNILPHKYDNSFKDITPTNDDYVLCFNKGNVLIRRTYGHLEIPTFREIVKSRYLFSIDSKRFFYVNYEDVFLLDDSYEFVDLKVIRTLDETKESTDFIMPYAIVCGKHYDFFIQHAKYCGVCGQKMVPSKIEMANICPNCNNTKYPDIMPAVAVAIINDDRILLTKYRGRKQPHYALVAGYVEVGETLEECVKREALEETGLHLYDIKYYMSQPWGFSNTIMVGFTAKSYDSKIKLEDNELGFADWFKREDVEVIENPVSMSHQIIQDFRLKKF